MELNEQQRAAVEHGENPLLIIAGAGTGKTRVIAHRIAWLIEHQKAKPNEILALTFTDKAALEMEERVDQLVPLGAFGYTISTFHAFGDRVLRDHGLVLGLNTDFKVLSKAEQTIFFQEHLFHFDLNYYRPLGNPTKHIEAILTLISRAKDEDVSPDEYISYSQSLKAQAENTPEDQELQEKAQEAIELGLAYRQYQQVLLQQGLLDFGDLVALPLNLFRKHPWILKRYQDRFLYILVDEFQDTNYIQFQLLHLLAQRNQNITVVGDDDQSIYKFRGAALSNLLNFSSRFPTARKIVLTENYRSTQPILDSAYRLIRHNDPDRLEVQHGIQKHLLGKAKEGKAVSFIRYDTLSSESDGISRLIEERTQTGKYAYGDFAILIRANKDATPYIQSLNLRGIPFSFSGNRGLYQREEIRILLAFLRVVSDPNENTALFYLVTSHLYALPMKDLISLMSFSKRYQRPLFDIFQKVYEEKELSGWTLEERMNLSKVAEGFSLEGRATLGKFLQDIFRYTELSRSVTTGVLLYTFLTDSGYLQQLGGEDTAEADRSIQNIAKFFESIKHFEYIAPQDRVHQVVHHLDLLIESGDDPAAADFPSENEMVQILTVHKAKGLEFRVVFLVGLVDQHFPSRRRKDPIEFPENLIKDLLPSGDFHIQEERRLFYVGMTRAREELILSSSHDRGGKRLRRVSPFVLETLGVTEGQATLRSPSAIQQIERYAPSPPSEVLPFQLLQDHELLHLSYYQIDDYLTCPLKYKYVHVLKVPIYKHHSIIYGNALHRAIQEYLRAKIEDQPYSLPSLHEAFQLAWSSEGFLNREHEQLRFETGLATLTRFYESQEKEGKVPTFIEKEFSVLLDQNKIAGRWDRIDVRDGSVTIIDYKSSNVQTQEKAKQEIRKNLQLSIYAYAYREIEGKIPDQIQLYFLESGLVGSLAKTEKDLEKTMEQIRAVAAGIRKGDFAPKPTFIACRYCPYRGICPYTATQD